MRTTLFTLICLLLSSPLLASKLIVSSAIGFDPNDNTSNLQFALEFTTQDTIVVDDVGMDWWTGPLRVRRNNVTIIFEPGVVVRALPGVFGIYEPLLNLTDLNDVHIRGYGATLHMNKQEYINLGDSEYRHAVLLASVTNVQVEGLTVRDSGGDGFILTKSFHPSSTQNYCENVRLKDCRSINNYRQGLSIVSAQQVEVLNCEFTETKGTLPEAGIDIEPDTPTERIHDVLIKDCRITHNHGNAIQLAMTFLDDTSLDLDVRIENTFMSNNHDPSNAYVYAEIAAYDNGSNGVDGQVTFRNCLIGPSSWSGLYVSKTVESYQLDFEDCVFKGVSQDTLPFNSPVFFEVTDYTNTVPRFGGVSFTDCSIFYDQSIPYFDLYENLPTSPGLGNVTGNFFLVNPATMASNTGQNPANVNLSFQHFPQFAADSVDLTAGVVQFQEADREMPFAVQRSGLAGVPTAISLGMTGTAVEGLDYSLHPGFVLFSHNVLVVQDTLEALLDALTEPMETIDLQVQSDACVEPGLNGGLTLFLVDSLGTEVRTDLAAEVRVYPNPATASVQLAGEGLVLRVEVWTLEGKLLRDYGDQSLPFQFEVGDWPAGMYLLKGIDAEGGVGLSRVFQKR